MTSLCRGIRVQRCPNVTRIIHLFTNPKLPISQSSRRLLTTLIANSESSGSNPQSLVNRFREAWDANPLSLRFQAAVVVISAVIAGTAYDGNEALQLLIDFENNIAPLVQSEAELTVQESTLRHLAKVAQESDAVQRAVYFHYKLRERVLAWLTDPEISPVLRAKAASLLNEVTRERSVQESMMKNGDYKTIVHAIETLIRDTTTEHTQRMLALSVSTLAQNEANHVALAKAGAISLLELVYQTKQVREVRDALFEMSETCYRLGREECNWASDEMWASIVRQYNEYQKWKVSIPSRIKNVIDSFGLGLYINVITGGLVWGGIVGFREKLVGPALYSVIGRTALVTGLVPAYFVGFLTKSYLSLARKVETAGEEQLLRFGVFYVLINSCAIILRKVEAVSPYWKGAHILGFSFFGLYLMWDDPQYLEDTQEKLYLILPRFFQTKKVGELTPKDKLKAIPPSLGGKEIKTIAQKRKLLEDIRKEIDQIPSSSSSSSKS